MPFSFIEIEERKKRVIFFLFLFLIFFYFLSFWFLTITARFALFSVSMTSLRQAFYLTPKYIFTILGIALLAAIFHWLTAVADSTEWLLRILKALPPDKEDAYHKRLQNIIDEISVATGGKKINCVVLPVFALNAFSIADLRNQAIIGVTEGIISRLNRAQLEAVVAHETAHIVSGDTLVKTITVSLFGVYGTILTGLRAGMEQSSKGYYGRGGRGLNPSVLIIYLVTSIIYGLSKFIAMFISRECEYRADAVAVRLVRDPLSLAQGLYKISRAWRGGGL